MRILMYAAAAASLVTVPLAASNPHAANPPTSTTTVQTHGNPHTTTAPSSPSSTTTTKTTSPTTTTTSTTGGTTTTTTPKTTTLNPIAAKISSHPQLSSRLTAMLPTGMTLNQASAGFKNQGQFIAALHVSKNLNIPFKDLRTQMVTDHKSLGQSIQKLRTTADADGAVKTAQHEADDDVKTAGK